MKKSTDTILTALIIVIFLTVGGMIIGQFTVGILLSMLLHFISGSIYPVLTEGGIKIIADNCAFSMVCILLFLYVEKIRKQNFKKTCFNQPHNTIPKFILGLVFGFATSTIIIIITLLHGDITITYKHCNIGAFILFFFAAIIQAGTEEILLRGYLMETIKNRYSVPIAIIANSLVFSFMHIFNSGIDFLGIANIVIIGFAFSLLVCKFQSLYLVIGLHTMWNFTEEILFGLPNSGLTCDMSLFEISRSEGSIFYNQAFGIEASIQTLLLWGIVVLVLCLDKWKKENFSFI